MQFTSSILIVASFMATGLMASPLSARDTDASASRNYTELFRETATTGSGHLVYYGLPPSSGNHNNTREDAAIEPRQQSCSFTAHPKCDDDHTARNDVCDQLVTELYGNSDVGVGESPRQICFEGNAEDNKYCCVSWHNVVPGLIKGDLAEYAATSKLSDIMLLV
ncbi:hypothetical protein K402DRAFT_389882 [Aulographum hederae CBS 113979]|uniref:WD-like domain-containing protein n=1 Tax=Aulographum hederae CBS 113979 TaxID=1176131 RepID=A0A6G1HAR9_9PEZI|nr:hypothetical protein K402DRAFT_389882 [Aulographum hederae CBS 113979]